MNKQISWTYDMTEFLYILRDVLRYTFPVCAENINREYGLNITDRSCIGAYHRGKIRGWSLPDDARNDVCAHAGIFI